MQYKNINREQIIHLLKEKNVMDFEHSEKTLLDHLENTERILLEWDQKEAVCLAGLLHSVFGTEVFTNILIPDSDRAEITKIVGQEVADLIFYFGIMERKHFLAQVSKITEKYFIKNRQTEEIYQISRKTFVDICHIYLANTLEQHPRWPKQLQFREIEEMKAMRNIVNKKAVQDLNKEYRL